jgi:hypothetical protein
MDVREKFGDVVIDDVRLWGEARTIEHIAEIMERCLTVPIFCIGGLWTMVEVLF